MFHLIENNKCPIRFYFLSTLCSVALQVVSNTAILIINPFIQNLNTYTSKVVIHKLRTFFFNFLEPKGNYVCSLNIYFDGQDANLNLLSINMK